MKAIKRFLSKSAGGKKEAVQSSEEARQDCASCSGSSTHQSSAERVAPTFLAWPREQAARARTGSSGGHSNITLNQSVETVPQLSTYSALKSSRSASLAHPPNEQGSSVAASAACSPVISAKASSLAPASPTRGTQPCQSTVHGVTLSPTSTRASSFATDFKQSGSTSQLARGVGPNRRPTGDGLPHSGRTTGDGWGAASLAPSRAPAARGTSSPGARVATAPDGGAAPVVPGGSAPGSRPATARTHSSLPPIDSPLLGRPAFQVDALSSASNRSALPYSGSSAGHHALPEPSLSPQVASSSRERNSLPRERASACRDGVASLDITLDKLPAVQHLAESGWTRVLADNIKSVAVAHGSLGYLGSSQPNSPFASQLGMRSSVQSVRRRSSTLGFGGSGCDGGGGGGGGGNGGGGGGGAGGANWEFLGSNTPAQQAGPGASATSNLLGSLEDVEDAEGEPVALPNVVPDALLEEAARAGVSLQVDLEAEVVFSTDPPLGRGVSGTVFKATYKGQPCAVKMLDPDILLGSGTSELQTFVQEMVVLASVRHPSIVAFMGGSLQPPSVFCIEELAETSLDAWLYKGGGAGAPPMNSYQQLKVALDVAVGLQYLHERTPAIVHRDLKPANILIDRNWNAKISDFGLARIKTHAVIHTKAPEVGSIGYMAPECFTSEDGQLSDKCDAWSFGVVLWEMCTRKRPWPGLTMPQYYREVVVRKSRLPIPSDDNVCPLALRRLISSCWADAPHERPSCAHIVAELTRLLKYCPRE